MVVSNDKDTAGKSQSAGSSPVRAQGLRRRRRADGQKSPRDSLSTEDDSVSSGEDSDGDGVRGIRRSISEIHIGIGWHEKLTGWLEVILSPRNVATLIYALSYTVSLSVLPFMARRHINGESVEIDNGEGKMITVEQGGVPEAWRGIVYGLVMSGYYASKMIFAPLIGAGSDKLGRRVSLAFTLLGSSATFALTFLVGQYSVEGLILCRLLLGCFASNGALMMAYIRDTVPKDQHTSAFAQYSAAWGLASVMASPILAGLGEDVSMCLVFAAVCMGISGFLVMFWFEEVAPQVRDADIARRSSSAIGPGTDRLERTDSSVGSNSNLGGKVKGRRRRQLKAVLNVFRTMLEERLLLGLFLLQAVRPAQDMAPLLNEKFGAGATIVAGMNSIRAATHVLLPLTPLIPLLNKAFGDGKGGPTDVKQPAQGGNRLVAAFMCVMMAGIMLLIPLCPNIYLMYVLVTLKSVCFVVKESTASAIMSSLANSGSIGAFFGWQHFMKGLAGVTGHMATGLLISIGPDFPYYATSACDLLYAAAYLYA